MKLDVYRIDLGKEPKAVVFVNGIIARNSKGFTWMWKNVLWIRSVTAKAEGCIQVKAGVCGPNEIIMVSYWKSQEALINFFRGSAHAKMMQFTMNNPEALTLFNETYSPVRSGKYSNEAHGLAKMYPRIGNYE